MPDRSRAGIASRSWLPWTGVAGLALFVPVLLELDTSSLRALVARADRALLAAALALLIGEGFCSTLRLRALLGVAAGWALSLRITAWHVLWVMLLPARLGDVVGVTLINRQARERLGPAAVNVLVQRLFDLIALALTFAITVLFLGSGFALGRLAWAALALGVCVPLLVRALPALLALVVRLLGAPRQRPHGPRRALVRAALQTRAWLRHRLTARRARTVFALSVVKWGLNLLGITVLVQALALPLDPTETLLIAALYNLLAAVPLQSVGGIGFTDLSLMTVFGWFGMPTVEAAGASIAIRLCLILAPLGFWALALTLLAAVHAARHDSAGHGPR